MIECASILASIEWCDSCYLRHQHVNVSGFTADYWASIDPFPTGIRTITSGINLQSVARSRPNTTSPSNPSLLQCSLLIYPTVELKNPNEREREREREMRCCHRRRWLIEFQLPAVAAMASFIDRLSTTSIGHFLPHFNQEDETADRCFHVAPSFFFERKAVEQLTGFNGAFILSMHFYGIFMTLFIFIHPGIFLHWFGRRKKKKRNAGNELIRPEMMM